MSFWNLSTGATPTGSEEEAHTGGFKSIPDGTQSVAIITRFFLETQFAQPFYNIHWKIVSDPYKNAVIFHSLNVFSDKPAVSDRSKQMMMRIFKLCGVTPTDLNAAPTDFDLNGCCNKPLGIKIGEFLRTSGKHAGSMANTVNEVHAQEGFDIKEPVLDDSALTRNAGYNKAESDVPW